VSTPEVIFWLALAVFGTIDSALWSGLETALYVVSRLRLESRLHDRRAARAARRLQRELESPRSALATLLVMNNLSNYLGALALAKLLAATGLPDWAVTLINIAVLTPILFVFAETLPKEVFRTRAEVLAYALCPILTTVRRILTVLGIVPVILFITGFAERLLGGKPIQTDSGERVRAILQEAEGAGVLSQEQAELLDRAAAFGTTTVADEMTPWAAVRKIRDSATIAQAAANAVSAGRSRFPLLDRRGHPVGIVSAYDLLRAKSKPGTTPRDLARQPVTIDQATEVPKALAILSEAGSPIAIVTAKSKPVGIVTVKDLVEPLTGDLEAW
jgi:putative hemolysin